MRLKRLQCNFALWPQTSYNIAMADENTPRATQRPPHVRAPAHWQRDDGPPAPRAVAHEPQSPKGDMPDPTRYGDWELKGIAVDF